MKLKLNNSSISFNKLVEPLDSVSKQTNFFVRGTTGSYGTSYDVYLYDITNAKKVIIGNATALSGSGQNPGGQIGLHAVISDISNIPADHTWTNDDSPSAFMAKFTQRAAVYSPSAEGDYKGKTEDEEFSIPSGTNVLMVTTLKTNGTPKVVVIEEY